MIVYVYKVVNLDNIFLLSYMLYERIEGNDIYPSSLNVMVNYHYHIENRVITR